MLLKVTGRVENEYIYTQGTPCYLAACKNTGCSFSFMEEARMGIVGEERNKGNCVENGLTMRMLRDNITSKISLVC